MGTETRSAERIAIEVLQAINDRDFDQIDRLSTEDVQLRMPPGQVFYGRPGIRAFFEGLRRLMPTLTLVARKVRAGEGFAVVEYEGVGTSSSSGDEVPSLGAFVIDLQGDQVSRCQLYLDTAQWNRLQEGAL